MLIASWGFWIGFASGAASIVLFLLAVLPGETECDEDCAICGKDWK